MYFGKAIEGDKELKMERIKQYLKTGNANLLILGPSGSGKTNMCFREIKELENLSAIREPINVYYFTPEEAYEKATLYSQKVMHDKVNLHIHTFTELSDDFIQEEGLYQTYFQNSFMPNYIYMDGIDRMNLKQFDLLQKMLRGVGGYHNIYTICMEQFLPVAKYYHIHTMVNEICILSQMPYYLRDAYPLNLIDYKKAYNYIFYSLTKGKNEKDKTPKRYGWIGNVNHGEKGMLFYADKEPIDYNDIQLRN